MKRRVAGIATGALLLWFTDPGGAYRLLDRRWPSGAVIVMHLQQGSSGGPLADGSPDWNAVTEGALDAWNPVLSAVTFREVSGSSADVSLYNGVNNVAWADDVYGEAFDSAIAVTISLSRGGVTEETDVLFDRARSWNSYRGGLRNASGGGTLFDLRRVALHEFGHVLGLGHPDDVGQSVTAIMNSRISAVDNLQSDDVNGVRAIYGGKGGGSPAPSNRAPIVTAQCSPCTVEADLTSRLRATARDPDHDRLTYRWSAPEGTFSNPTDSDTDWTAPARAGVVTATITVENPRGGRATATVQLEVIPRDRLRANARLLDGQSLVSPGRRYRLVFQGDGNLVLYDDQEQRPLWASNTSASGAGQAIMQGDGNLVVYDDAGRDRWASGTAGTADAYLQLQDDGNLVVYGPGGQPLWDRFQETAPARVRLRRGASARRR
jgi:hypothetical protein